MDRAGQEVFLDRFLPLCAEAGSACAFSSGGNLRAKWRTLLARAQAGQLSYQDLMIFAYYDMFVEPSTCRDDAELGYLVSLQLPPKGTVCNVDQLPWA